MKQFCTAVLLLLATALTAQTKVQLSIPDVIAPGGEELICVPVVADSFPDIAGVQFSIGWDTSQVTFVEARYGANPLDLDDGRITEPRDDNFGVSFSTDDLSGIELAPETVLFELCFSADNASGSTPLNYVGLNVPEFIKEDEIVEFPFDTIPGSITYGSDVAVGLFPGDTNDDGKVDHTDLLNIGLVHGTDGPARNDDGSSFAPVVAPVWPGNFANDLNHALADADGDGSVADADLNVVDAFYGRNADGLQPPDEDNPTTGRELMPNLSLSGGPLRTGEPGVLTVSLGDGNDPDAVGYGMAFTISYDPDLIDEQSISVDFGNSYLGVDLLTIAKVSPVEAGKLEIALSRKDQTNTPAPGGEVCQITLTARENAAEEDYDLRLELSPDTYLLTDESSVDVTGSIATVMVETTVAVREPVWGRSLVVYPNPYVSGPLYLRGDLPRLRQVKVLDVAGRTVQSLPGNVRELDLFNLQAGNYLLQLESISGTVNRRIIKR
ncbi:MAG: T9SS type A sorting domain-containing protein [Bacteroidota bacterium]